MIKQLNTTPGDRRYDPEWPDDPMVTQTLFSGRQALRSLRVMIDGGLLPDTETPSSTLTKLDVLDSLLSHKLVTVFKYAFENPPEGIEPKSYKKMPNPSYPVFDGWAVAYPRTEQSGYWPVTYAPDENSYAHSGVIDNSIDIARVDESQTVYSDLEQEARQKQREQDMLALEVASQSIHADIFITERPYLFSNSRLVANSTRGITVSKLEESITLISLYLRQQGLFIMPSSSPGVLFTYNRGLYFWVGMRELLPEGWRWFSSCVQHSTAANDNHLLLLGGSLLSRVSRALQARDEVHVSLDQPVNNDTSDDALSSLDMVLVLLMGAVDASSRVAHNVLGLSGAEKYAGWQSSSWLARVAAHAPGLSAVVDPGTPGEHTLTILRLLRNSVHGAALQGVSYLNNGNHETLVGLPVGDEVNILAAMDAMGGRASWGFRPIVPGKSHVEPAVLVDRLFEEIVVLLNAIMKETPVELLPNVVISTENTKPPVDTPDRGHANTFSEWNRLAIRWHLGF